MKLFIEKKGIGWKCRKTVALIKKMFGIDLPYLLSVWCKGTGVKVHLVLGIEMNPSFPKQSKEGKENDEIKVFIESRPKFWKV